MRSAVIPGGVTATGSRAKAPDHPGVRLVDEKSESRPAREEFFLDFPFHRTGLWPSLSLHRLGGLPFTRAERGDAEGTE